MAAIYTKSGDTGETSLLGGIRAPKNSLKVEAYGTVDELSACIGTVRAIIFETVQSIYEQLEIIQHHLFTIGTLLATPEGAYSDLQVKPQWITLLENWIDASEETLPKLSTFILPGGSPASGHLHLARAICRRTERNIVSLSQHETLPPNVIVYINRLSDYLFMAARYLNLESDRQETTWNKDI
ncbi:MAG: cob(I)yrinic acid a,c-diamide adenosyltransferase [Candidatus Jacksonbacteria bacterium]|jgi:cob(I)alamin adenosyltransferase|nr:cob(I)yrinic acid a,c-diamide adenosyltransferase [Candidatus Jacksonbacteria bacterium]MBT6034618.1 cob(I)yrinic acid a,c-diamide adenosyltransferase [Candidatus Jacksonbacteria bacterium]MBT6301017.1 cob(I)yrinic acid a,c-diamide adenosyltransferase [Candidatus Jacksonbacteria bacterium]MBT6757198.1 cob(I)yrinic acid a,c-diamide adenosyltransferase [Candidatus Jacksonbacteria bacterium]MBT6954845.1 cob(I)yrinic acid a,c-diamide adenosyltransferase [Candidatus Jacksonbacteria bacterium]